MRQANPMDQQQPVNQSGPVELPVRSSSAAVSGCRISQIQPAGATQANQLAHRPAETQPTETRPYHGDQESRSIMSPGSRT